MARRYRPQTFDELIGQSHVAKALVNAIRHNRVGHAYLFTGARGVGKTSTARILAKALNCEKGPTPQPCNVCDICRSIAEGEDVDVLEIDGASNRGIDEIRQLRQNVTVRPSRARMKIYIIDEVHMLTREAFNALLKTLEEPPPHVKFIFCTTEPGKVPITILSRCQRFDFAGIETTAIVQRLAQIAEAEGITAQPEALELVARRAAGSMRDAQSLLEQLLAFCEGELTTDDVHRALGTAGTDRLEAIVSHLVAGRAKEAIEELHAAVAAGVDASLLLEQLLAYYRDIMVASVGCSGEYLVAASPGSLDTLRELGNKLGVTGLTTAMQLIDQTLARLRLVTHDLILADLTLVRLANLANLDDIAGVLRRLQVAGAVGPGGGDPGVKKNFVDPQPVAPQAVRRSPRPASSGAADLPRVGGSVSSTEAASDKAEEVDAAQSGSVELTRETAMEVWRRALKHVPSLTADQAKRYERIDVPEPGRMVVYFRSQNSFSKNYCEKPEQFARLQAAVSKVLGTRVRIEFAVVEGSARRTAIGGGNTLAPQQLLFEKAKHPLVKYAIDKFGARPTGVAKTKSRPEPPAEEPDSRGDTDHEE
ncbi:hypothetical protein JCM19992_22320 [Thermostilla marina]